MSLRWRVKTVSRQLMGSVKISFVISDLNEEDVRLLRDNYSIVSKMILTPDDYKLFRYNKGDRIQVETDHGNRLWCRIEDLEKVENPERIILILTLIHAPLDEV